jgi:hypothetical protein
MVLRHHSWGIIICKAEGGTACLLQDEPLYGELPSKQSHSSFVGRKQWHTTLKLTRHHVTRTGAPTFTPNIADAFSSTIASSSRPVEPTCAINVIGG